MRLLLVLCAATALSGCRFWYKPVPVANAIGEAETVLAGDTVNVHREQRFEVYGPSSEAVYDSYEQLNRAYRAFERFFGAPAPRLAVLVSADSAMPLDSASMRAMRDRGFTVVSYVRPRNFRSPSRYGALGYGGVVWPIAPTAARALLARFADAQLDGASSPPDSVLLDRFPLWYRAAVIQLVGDAGAPKDLELLRDKRNQVLPFMELVRLVRPSSADSLLDPSRREEADEVTRLIAAQSSTIARFIVEREGPAVIGRLARGYLAGRLLAEMITEFRNTPTALPELERRWKSWIDASVRNQ